MPIALSHLLLPKARAQCELLLGCCNHPLHGLDRMTTEDGLNILLILINALLWTIHNLVLTSCPNYIKHVWTGSFFPVYWFSTLLGFSLNNLQRPVHVPGTCFAWNTLPTGNSVICLYLSHYSWTPNVIASSLLSSSILNPIHPIGNSLKKQKNMYLVLTPSIKTSI